MKKKIKNPQHRFCPGSLSSISKTLILFSDPLKFCINICNVIIYLSIFIVNDILFVILS